GRLADSLLQGNGWAFPQPWGGVHQSWMPPVYPLLLAGLGWLSVPHRYLALQFLQAVLSAAMVLCVWLLGRRWFGRRTAWVGLVLAALYPPLAAKVAYVDPITLEALLLVLGVLLVGHALDMPEPIHGSSCGPRPPAATPGRAASSAMPIAPAAAAGLVLGLAVLTRPVFLAFVLALAVVWLLCYPRRRRSGAVMLACALLTVAPWTLRNAMVHRAFVLVSTNGGFNFWIGNNPLATGHAYAADGQPLWMRMPDSLRQRLAAAGELEQQRLFYAEAFGFAQQHPGRFVALSLRRLGWFWWFRPGAGEGQLTYPSPWVWGYHLCYGAVLALAPLGAWVARHQWRRLLPVCLLFASLTAVYSVFFVHTRYRMVLEPFLLLLAGHALACGWRRLGLRRSRRVNASPQTP
ncbi:MAG: hypothetical protein AB1505_35945, partial [Candidatus Latescibacterota bacterium]